MTFSTRWCAIWLMCSRPSLPGSRLISAPKSAVLGDRAFVDLTHFDLGGDLGDALLREVGLVAVGRRDGDGAVLADVDDAAGLLGQDIT